MSWRTEAKWAGIIVLLMTLVGGTLALNYWEQTRGDLRAAALDASEERIHSLDALLSIMQDAETGQRGYVITGLDEYLEPYDNARQRLGHALEVLDLHYGKRPQARMEMAHIVQLVSRKMNRVTQIIAVRRSQGFEAARDLVLDGIGKQTMDELRNEVAFMTSIERTHMAAAEQAYEVVQMRSRATFYLLAIVVLVSMGLLLAVAAREMRASQRANAKLGYLAGHDPMTGLANRRSLLAALEQVTQASRAPEQQHGLFFLDLNGFKAVNDRFGHDVGDRLLVEVADQLKTITRASDVLARLGGDEFALLVPNLPSEVASFELMTRIREAVASVNVQGFGCRVSASIGCALFPNQAKTSADLLRLADQGMYADKRRSKGLTLPDRMASPEMHSAESAKTWSAQVA